MRTDLHIHTTASDSRWTVEQVVAGVQAAGIGLFAIADHDSTSSVPRAEALARAAGIAFLRGVEVSTIDRDRNSGDSSDGERALHILGYGIDLDDAPLQALIAGNDAKLRATDDDHICDLIALGYPLDFEDYVAYEPTEIRGGWRSLNFLIDRGVCTDVRDFFANLWPKMSHHWPDFAHPADVVAAIRCAGGVPILAHPGASFTFDGFTEADLNAVLEYGIAGLECHSYAHDATMTARFVDYCIRHNLLVTGGSDYHGGFAGRQLGVPIVDSAALRLGELEDKIIQPRKT